MSLPAKSVSGCASCPEEKADSLPRPKWPYKSWSLITSLTLTPITLPCASCLQTRRSPCCSEWKARLALGPLHLLLPLRGSFFPLDIHMVCFLTPFKSLLRYNLNKAFPVKNRKPSLRTPPTPFYFLVTFLTWTCTVFSAYYIIFLFLLFRISL